MAGEERTSGRTEAAPDGRTPLLRPPQLGLVQAKSVDGTVAYLLITLIVDSASSS